MLRTALATVAGRSVRLAAKRRGGGSALPGLVAERIDPGYLRHCLGALPGGIVAVTGTNGKTTTTKMLVAVLRAHGRRVVTNPTGSNFTRGVISALLPQVALSGRLDADIAVLELDEAHALKFADVVPPTHALLLNIARDQLDRFAEIDHTAALLRRLALRVTTGVVLNRDDPFVSRIRDDLASTLDVGSFGLDASLAHRLAEIQEADVRFAEGERAAAGPADGTLQPIDVRSFAIDCAAGRVGPVTLQQRGLAAMINATAATTMARQLLGDDFDPDVAARALAEVRPPFGRGEVIDVGDGTVELVLVKNPAAFTVALATYGDAPSPTMIAINDADADGRDVSWLWDVSFTGLAAPGSPGVSVTSGTRGWDMALRLDYDGIDVAVTDTDLTAGLAALLAHHPGADRRIFCTYTAMMGLRRVLARRHGLADFGEEG